MPEGVFDGEGALEAEKYVAEISPPDLSTPHIPTIEKYANTIEKTVENIDGCGEEVHGVIVAGNKSGNAQIVLNVQVV